MQSVVISRAQYGALLAHEPQFMRHTYPTLERRWRLGWVTVSGPRTAVANLERLALLAERKEEAAYRAACVADRWDGQG
jgi:hypothetical protein